MLDNQNNIKKVILMSVGYLSSGIVMALFSSLGIWAKFLDLNANVGAVAFVSIFAVATCIGIILIRYLVPKFGKKAIYEHDILVCIIGLLFISLAINKAMLVVGIIITVGALAVFFYENFNRQVNYIRQGQNNFLHLSSWIAGPVIALAAIYFLSDFGIIVLRVLFAHYIAIGFWFWIQRLNVHESYFDAPDTLIASDEKKDNNI